MILLRNWLSLSIVPIPPGMRPSGPSDFSLQALTQNTNVYAEAALKITTSGTSVPLTPAQVLAKNIVLNAGASGPFTINLPSTSSLIDALGPTMPLDGSFFFELSIWNNATGQAGTLTPADASTTIDSSALPTDTVCKWMVRVNPVTSSGQTRPTSLTITRTSTAVSVGSAGSGTVVSVAQTVPVEFTISGSPVTTTGTLAIDKATEPANTVWAGPTSGADAQPTFRALVNADLPGGGTGGTVTSVGQTVPPEFTISGSPITSTGTLVIGKAVENANTVWAGPTSGGAAQPVFRPLVLGDLSFAANGFNPWLFGTGLDGAAHFDGVTTFSFATLIGSTYTLLRSIHLTDCTVDAGIRVLCWNANTGGGGGGGAQVYCTGTLTCNGVMGGEANFPSISNSLAFQGSGTVSCLYGAGGTSGAGGNPGNGTAGGGVGASAGGAGGAGGASQSGTGTHSGGAGGTVAPFASDQGSSNLLYNPYTAIYGRLTTQGSPFWSQIRGGGGGGGGGGKDSIAGGGAGGAGGAPFMVSARFIAAGSGRLSSNGGAGSSPTSSSAGGGGGGGGGGILWVMSQTTNFTSLVSCVANGGAAGLSGGAGTNGTAGSAGLVIPILVP